MLWLLAQLVEPAPEAAAQGNTNAEVLMAMEHLEQSLQQSTYLEADYQGEPIN